MLKSNMKADLIIKNARVIDVFQNRIIRGNIAIKDGRFIGVGNYSSGKEVIDINNAYVAPGMTDGHVHIESSFVSPAEFMKCLVARGVTTIIADPHEIANVCGLDGIKYILDESEDLKANVFVMLPSSVPATAFETSGATLLAEDYKDLIKHERVLGLGELMNFVGTINRDKDILDKIDLARSEDKLIDGHSPFVLGKDLDDYVIAGVQTDHECSTVEEMTERISRGMYVQIREGSASKNLETLIKGVTKDNISRCFFSTDDRHPEDLIKDGNVDNNVRKAIRLGIDPMDALKMATINPMLCYRLFDRGAIAPNYKADFFIFDDLEDIKAKMVFVAGEKVAEDGRVLVDFNQKIPETVKSSVRVSGITKEHLRLPLNSDRVNVIKIIKNSLITEREVCRVKTKDGFFEFSNDGISKLLVVERHTGRSTISIGLIKGYDIKKGACGTTVAHDSHNIIVAGDNDEDILNVINNIISMGGGLSISSKGQVLDSMPLDIAGLMTSDTIENVEKNLKRLLKTARGLGIEEGVDPFMTLSFMALPVIPHLKLTDKGLFDVDKFEIISIEE